MPLPHWHFSQEGVNLVTQSVAISPLPIRVTFLQQNHGHLFVSFGKKWVPLEQNSNLSSSVASPLA